MPAKNCTHCGHNNAPDALTCGGCGITLSSSEADNPPAADPKARSAVLRRFSSQIEAQIATKQLEEAGIPFIITADDGGGMLPSLNITRGIRLLVNETDVPRAEEVLRQIEPMQ